MGNQGSRWERARHAAQAASFSDILSHTRETQDLLEEAQLHFDLTLHLHRNLSIGGEGGHFGTEKGGLSFGEHGPRPERGEADQEQSNEETAKAKAVQRLRDAPAWLRGSALRECLLVRLSISSRDAAAPEAEDQSRPTSPATSSSQRLEGLRPRLLRLDQLCYCRELAKEISASRAASEGLPSSSSSSIRSAAEPTHSDSLDDECSICMEKNCEIVLPCSHAFCKDCASKIETTGGRCPFCASPVPAGRDGREDWQLESVDASDIRTVRDGLLRDLETFLQSLPEPTDQGARLRQHYFVIELDAGHLKNASALPPPPAPGTVAAAI